MTSNSFAANALEVLLSWFKSLVNGIWALFSGTGGSLLAWLSDHWLPLLVIFLVVGTTLDVVVYLLRWRPFWWWFRKKRMVVDDRLLDAPHSKRRAQPARVRPSTKVPVRVTPGREEEEVPASDDDLFMEPSLFDVKSSPAKGHGGELYAPARRSGSKAKR